jgi:hypothetical protein
MEIDFVGACQCAPNRALTFSASCRRQPWSTYAVHLTTLSPAAFVGDVALVWLLWVGTSEWPAEQAANALRALLGWMLFSKFIKLVTHFVRYPVDIFLWPVSILFGWFHGIIKFYAMLTLNEVRASSPPFFRPSFEVGSWSRSSAEHTFKGRSVCGTCACSLVCGDKEEPITRQSSRRCRIQTDVVFCADNVGQPRRSGCQRFGTHAQDYGSKE